MAFCKPDFIIIKSNYFQIPQKGECFLNDFEALVREIDIRVLTMRSRNVILKVEFKKYLFFLFIHSTFF
jgi:hypothetical protein